MNKISNLTAALLGLLSVEFVLGMISNLFVTFPDTTDQAQLMSASWHHWATASHIILGVGIVVLGFTVMIVSIQSKNRLLMMLGILGFTAILTAAVAGDRFVRTQHAAWSLTMAIGFIIAMGIFGRLMSLAKEAQSVLLKK